MGKEVPAQVITSKETAQVAASTSLRRRAGQPPAASPKQILFGDLHVHTTFSADAFMMSLPLMQGEGAHPVADACDFARYCSSLDFWSINDHAEALTPERWEETVETMRRCNAMAGDPTNPDVVAFLGWEWTQIGATPKEHYGHKNVILREWEPGRIPRRPIASGAVASRAMKQRPPLSLRLSVPLYDWDNRQRYLNLAYFQEEILDTPTCEDGVDTRDLPDDCMEAAATPEVLFRKLDQWGFDSLVIPHGTAWGLYTPAGSTLDKQLTDKQHDPGKQTLIEVYSGHGNSEEYRDWRAVEWDRSGRPICPEPTDEYEPCCWRAGEIIRSRCDNPDSPECAERVATAKLNYLNAGTAGRVSVPGSTVEDWKDCGSCRDCILPAFNYRPGNSVQYGLAISNLEDKKRPMDFQFGFIASSDTHTARPGTGYKEYGRQQMTEAAGPNSRYWRERIWPNSDVSDESIEVDPADPDLLATSLLDFERGNSFFLTGGLAAVHASGRDRESVWAALERRETYGTSGPRILLWFDLTNAPLGMMPMGSKVAMREAPRFRVRALGSFKQKPGCPAHSTRALRPARLEALCRGECYHPSDVRNLITRIEVVRILPQRKANEDVGKLIEDPWKTFECPADPAGCVFEFDDPSFTPGDRSAVYYVRAIEEPSKAVNADGLRCRYDEDGRCVEVNPCYGDDRTAYDDDCLGTVEERAWSSPIFVEPRRR